MASTTSFRYFGDHVTGRKLIDLTQHLLARVRQEASWNNLPTLRRTFALGPCAHSPNGAMVVVDRTYGVENVYVYVQPSGGRKQIVEYETKVYLHLFIRSKEHPTERKGVSLVWDIKENGYPQLDFGINGIVETAAAGGFLGRSTKSSRPVFPINDEEEFNDLLQERVVSWDSFEKYHVPRIEEYLDPKGEVISSLTGSDGAASHLTSWEEEDSGCSGSPDYEQCLCDVLEFPLPGVDLDGRILYPTDVYRINYQEDIRETAGTETDDTGALVTDESPANIGYDYGYSWNSRNREVAWTSNASGCADALIDLGIMVLDSDHQTGITNVVSSEHTNYLTAFLYYQDLLWNLYNDSEIPAWNTIKAPILPSFSVEAKNLAGTNINFHVKHSIAYALALNSDGGARYPVQAQGYEPPFGRFPFWTITGAAESYPGNLQQYVHDMSFEFFTPLGSMGSISGVAETVYQYTVVGDWHDEEEGSEGIASVEADTASVRFFYGRPAYLAQYDPHTIVQVYAYDFNYHDVETAFTVSGGYSPNPSKSQRLAPYFLDGNVEPYLTKLPRDLLVIASASWNGYSSNANTDPRQMPRNPTLELEVKNLFTQYYEINALPTNTVDEDYEVKLELRTLTLRTVKEVDA